MGKNRACAPEVSKQIKPNRQKYEANRHRKVKCQCTNTSAFIGAPKGHVYAKRYDRKAYGCYLTHCNFILFV